MCAGPFVWGMGQIDAKRLAFVRKIPAATDFDGEPFY